MALDAYIGNPGSGKSHGVVKSVILPALKAGRVVVHNMPLDEKEIAALGHPGLLVKIPDDKRTPADFVAWFRDGYRGALLVLDEAWRYWPSGLKAHTIPEIERSFFAEHRHLVGDTTDGKTTDIVLVTQNLGQIARFIVDLVDQSFHHTKHDFAGLSKLYRVDVYQGSVTGAKPPKSKRISSVQGKYDPAIFKLYKSHTLSTTGAAGVEDKVDKRGSMLKSWTVRSALIAIVLMPLLAWWAWHSFWAVGKMADKEAPAGTSERSEQVPAGAPPPPPPKESPTWRVTARIVSGGEVYVWIDSPNGSRRMAVEDCHFDKAHNYECELEGGQLVTEWSGTKPEGPVEAFVTAAAAPETTGSEVGHE